MKTLNKLIPFFIVLVLLFSLPVVVLAQEPPPGQTFSGDKLIFGDDYFLREGQVLNGNLVVLGGNVVIETNATVNGDIALVGGNLDFSGTISGTISAIGGNVVFNSGAIVRGNVDTFGGNLSGTDEATIFGRVNTLTPRTVLFNYDRIYGGTIDPLHPLKIAGTFLNDILSNILRILAFAILALVVALLMPKPLDRVTQSIASQPLLSGGIGILTLLLTPLILLILIITLLLIPVALIAVLVLTVALLFGWIAIGYEIGRRLAVLLKTHWAEAISAGLGTLVLGTIIWLFGYIFCLGGLISILVASVGLGGVILSKFGTQGYPTNSSTRSTLIPPVIPPIDPSPSVVQSNPTEMEQPSNGVKSEIKGQ